MSGRPAILAIVVVLVAEDTSAGRLACYGDRLARTPTIDALASRSVVFDRCFANPVCDLPPVRATSSLYIAGAFLTETSLRAERRSTPAARARRAWGTAAAGAVTLPPVAPAWEPACT